MNIFIAKKQNSHKKCPEGKELNHKTNRCIKSRTLEKVNAVNTGADYPIITNFDNQKYNFISTGAVVLVILFSFLYTIFQFRNEILRLFKKIKEKRKIRQLRQYPYRQKWRR